MADIQRQLIQFDEAIRLKRFDENATLREKRDAVLTRLRDQHNALRRQGVKVPVFDWFNQGSYQMGTGVTPADGDFDIDVGLRFDCTRADYSDPVALKNLVFNALDGHTQRVELRRSCVTVFYQRAGEPVYHVDLAVYARESALFGGDELYIAKGKANSGPTAVTLPVEPRGDLCERMTDGQMTTLRGRLIRLRDALIAARNDRDTTTACARLRGEFGDAFPLA
jgi:hypothetical protein